MSDEAAAIAACAIGTSLNAVRDTGRVALGESVLITGAGGGLGVHALQLARAAGAHVIAQTTAADKAGLLTELGAHEVVIGARGEDFSARVHAVTGGRGADVVIDNVGTPQFEATRRSLAENGRWVLVGQVSGGFVPFSPAQLFLRNQSMLSVHSTSRTQLEDTLALLARGAVRAVVTGTCSLDELPAVHRQMEAGGVAGRIVLRMTGRAGCRRRDGLAMNASVLLENTLQALYAGLAVGALYGLMCVGLALIFSVMRVINFAQGELLVAGMYASLFLFAPLGLGALLGPYAGPVAGALLGGVIVFFLGALLYETLLRHVSGLRAAGMEGEGHNPQLTLTLGVSLILSNGALLVFGSSPQTLRTPMSANAWTIGPFGGGDLMVFMNQARTVGAVIAVAVALATAFFITRTRWGKSCAPRPTTRRGDLHGHRRRPRASHRLRRRRRQSPRIAGGLVATYLPVPALHRARLRHDHVCRRGARRHGQRARRLLGRPDHRPRAAALDAGAAAAAAERGHLRGLPARRRCSGRRACSAVRADRT